jgi:hypothetical protein
MVARNRKRIVVWVNDLSVFFVVRRKIDAERCASGEVIKDDDGFE